MAKRPRGAKKREGGHSLSPEQVDDLVGGFTLLDTPLEELWRTEEVRRAAWFKYRDYIMRYQGRGVVPGGEIFAVCEHGERPSGWWDYEAPGMRRMTKGLAEDCYPEMGKYRGMYRMWKSHDAVEYESEFVFLRRRKLLLSGEGVAYENAQKRVEIQRKAALKGLKLIK